MPRIHRDPRSHTGLSQMSLQSTPEQPHPWQDIWFFFNSNLDFEYAIHNYQSSPPCRTLGLQIQLRNWKTMSFVQLSLFPSTQPLINSTASCVTVGLIFFFFFRFRFVRSCSTCLCLVRFTYYSVPSSSPIPFVKNQPNKKIKNNE